VFEKYPGKVKLVFKNYPLRQHRFAATAALAALAAGRQGKFWEFHDLLFENSDRLSTEKVNEIASGLHLDMDRFGRDVRDQDLMALIRQDGEDARKAGIKGVPAVFVKGRPLQNRTMAGFDELIAKALAGGDN